MAGVFLGEAFLIFLVFGAGFALGLDFEAAFLEAFPLELADLLFSLFGASFAGDLAFLGFGS